MYIYVCVCVVTKLYWMLSSRLQLDWVDSLWWLGVLMYMCIYMLLVLVLGLGPAWWGIVFNWAPRRGRRG